MTKPTGRPRGRPKTREYVTLMARVPQELADRVQRYAGLHQQPISVVLRDALEVLLEAERYQPFVSDRNRDGAAETAQEAATEVSSQPIPAILSDTKEERSALAAASAARHAPILSDAKADKSPHARTAKMSDRKAGHRDRQEGHLSDTKADDHPPDVQETVTAILSDTKEGQIASQPAFLSDTNVPAFDPSKYILGKLCPRRHEHGTTGQSLLRISNRHCGACDREKWHEKGSARRQAQRQAQRQV